MTSSSPWRATPDALLLLLCLLLGGCGGGGGSGRPEKAASRLESAASRAITALLAQAGEHDVGTLHVLLRAATVLGRKDAVEFVAKEAERFSNDLYRGLLLPGLPPAPLLLDRGRGYARLQWHLTHAATRADPPKSKAAIASRRCRAPRAVTTVTRARAIKT